MKPPRRVRARIKGKHLHYVRLIYFRSKREKIDHCDLILICVVKDAENPATPPTRCVEVCFEFFPSNTIQFSPLLSVEMHFVAPSRLCDAFVDLAVTHFRLSAIEVSDIPSTVLKEVDTSVVPGPEKVKENVEESREFAQFFYAHPDPVTACAHRMSRSETLVL